MPTDLTPLAVAERTDLLELLRTLTPEQWATTSLAGEWTVRDVAVHVVSYDVLSLPQTLAALARGRLDVDRVNQQQVRAHRDLSDQQVLELVATHLTPTGIGGALGAPVGLTDALIHHQDVRRALDLPRSIPAERLVPVLSFSLKAPPLPSRGNARGLRLVATDVDWTHGSGPEVRGPGEAVLMAVAGRPDALGELTGPGVAQLRSRVTG